MKKLLIVLPFIFACTKSSSPVCAVEQTLAGVLSATISKSLNCSNSSQIQTDILASLGKANLCATKASGPIGDIVCPIAVAQVTALIGSKVPSSWGCNVSDTSTVSAALLTACKAVVPLNK